MSYEIYTDGATSNNGKSNAVGGWAYVILKDGHLISRQSGGEKNTTNQRMELTAALKACQELEELDPFARVRVYSDSAYLINCWEQHWWRGWQANGWKNAKKQSVINQDLWLGLIHFFQKTPNGYDFIKVKGHAGNKWNEYVDEMAVRAKESVMR